MSREMADSDVVSRNVERAPHTSAMSSYRTYAEVLRSDEHCSNPAASKTVSFGSPFLPSEPLYPFWHNDNEYDGDILEHDISFDPAVSRPESYSAATHQQVERHPVSRTYAEALQSLTVPPTSAAIHNARMSTPSLSQGPTSSSLSTQSKSRSGARHSSWGPRPAKVRKTGNMVNLRPPSPVHDWLDEIENKDQGHGTSPGHESMFGWDQPSPFSGLPSSITSNPNFHSGLSEPSRNVAGWAAQPRAARDQRTPRLGLSRLALSTRAPSEASSIRSPLSVTSLSSSRLNARRTKQQMLYGSSKLRCHVCYAGFETKSDLSHHMRSHTPYEGRPHECTNCAKRFLYAKDLRRHEKTHGAKQIFCPHMSCKFATTGFRRQDHLDRHVRSQHAVDARSPLLPSASPWRSGNTPVIEAVPTFSTTPAQPASPLATALNPEARPFQPAMDTSSYVRKVTKVHPLRRETDTDPPEAHTMFAGAFSYIKHPTGHGHSDHSQHANDRRHGELPTEPARSQTPTSSMTSEPTLHGSLLSNNEEIDPGKDRKCVCRPQECHANTCSPEDLSGDRAPDIRRLIAFIARHGAQQTSGPVTSPTQENTTDTAKLIERAALSFLKRSRSEDREDDNGDAGVPKKKKTAAPDGPKDELKFRCPISADCDLANLSIMCICCRWDGSPRFCDVRLHIKRTHFDEATGKFKQCDGHKISTVTFAGLDHELRRLERMKASPAAKWRATFQYIYSTEEAADVPNPFVDTTTAQRLIQYIIQITNERDAFWNFDSILGATAEPTDPNERQREPQHQNMQRHTPPSSTTTPFESDAGNLGLEASPSHKIHQRTTVDQAFDHQAVTTPAARDKVLKTSSLSTSSRDEGSHARFSGGGSSIRHSFVPDSSITSVSNYRSTSGAQIYHPEYVPMLAQSAAVAATTVTQDPTRLTPPSAAHPGLFFDSESAVGDDFLSGLGDGFAESSSGGIRYDQRIDVGTEGGNAKAKKKRKWQRLDFW